MVWDAHTGELKHTFKTEAMSAVAFSPDGRWLVIGNRDYRFWEVGTWKPGLRILRPTLQGCPLGMTFSRDGNIFAHSYDQRSVRLTDTATGAELATLEPPNPWPVRTLSFNADASRLAISGENASEIHVWNLCLIRQQLTAMGLDWNLPPYPPETNLPRSVVVANLSIPSPAPNAGSEKTSMPRGPTQPTRAPREPIPPRDPQARTNLVDLTRYYTGGFRGNWHGDARAYNYLASLPTGIQRLAGVDFDVRGLIQLDSGDSAKPRFAMQVTNMTVGLNCGQLHFLHAAIWGPLTNPVEIGYYTLNYADGQKRKLPILFNQHVRDWWSGSDESSLPEGTVVAWQGTNPKSQVDGKKIRLFKTVWQNPLAGVELLSIDFASAMASAAPFLVAITVDLAAETPK